VAIKGFSKWLHDSDRTRKYDLRIVAGFNAKEDLRHERRTISLEELRRLIEAAETGEPFKSMTGPMRAMCYRLAVASGLRYSEIASIKPEAFDWSANTVTIHAGYAKNGQTATLRISPELATDLARYVAPLAPGNQSSRSHQAEARRCCERTWNGPASPTRMVEGASLTSTRSAVNWRPWLMPREYPLALFSG
jgi:integrase